MPRLDVLNASILRHAYPARRAWSAKGDYGRLLIIGGSEVYTGSPGLVALSATATQALAALNAGADLVRIFAPQRVADAAAGYAPDLITVPSSSAHFVPRDLKSALAHAKTSTAVVIGNGAGTHAQTRQFIRAFIAKCQAPLVVDADGVRALGNASQSKANARLWKRVEIATPNAREFEVMTGVKPPEDVTRRARLVSEWAGKLETTIVLKGHVDVISNGLETALNKSGSVFMTKGGTGDTLAGLAGAFLAAGRAPFLAACAATYLNGAAGTLAAKKWGVSLTASRLVSEIPNALKRSALARGWLLS